MQPKKVFLKRVRAQRRAKAKTLAPVLRLVTQLIEDANRHNVFEHADRAVNTMLVRIPQDNLTNDERMHILKALREMA